MMMEKCTRWETSGRRNTWVPSVPVPAMVDSRCVSVCAGSVVCLDLYSQMCLPMCDCYIFVSKQGWRCENCKRPGSTDVNADVLHPVPSDAFDRYRENALRKLVS